MVALIVASVRRMYRQRALAYLLGVEGVALLRGFRGDFDDDFVEARIAEVRRLLDDPSVADAEVTVDRLDTVAGYREWSATYDEEDNGCFDIDEPILAEIFDAAPLGVALDAACGTGRHAARLAARGHRVIGVDSSPDMLARAQARVPGGDFRLGDLRRLPVPDDAVDVVVCALALTHIPALPPVMSEFARVLRPGGHLVLADVHHELVLRTSGPAVRLAASRPARMPAHRHLVGDYLRAALPLNFQVLRCEEPGAAPWDGGDATPVPPRPVDVGPWYDWPWSLQPLVPDAARAASAGVPAMLIWHFQLRDTA
jgi:SAM-dependent methyltransferase